MKKTLLLLIPTLILTSCSLQKYCLEQPSVTVENGYILSWNPIKGADFYSVINADTGEEIINTKETRVIMENFAEGINTQIIAKFENENFIFSNSKPSETVSLKKGKLFTPEVQYKDNKVTWTNVPNADYYLIYKNEDTNYFYKTTENEFTYSGETEKASFYVVACYDDSSLEEFSSSKSKSFYLQPDVVVFDKESYSTPIAILPYQKKIVLCSASMKTSFDIKERNIPLEVEIQSEIIRPLSNLSIFYSSDNTIAPVFFEYKNACTMYGYDVTDLNSDDKASPAINLNNVKIDNPGNYLVYFYGGNGYDCSAKKASDGAASIIVNNLEIIGNASFFGGDGGNGLTGNGSNKDGANGCDGGDGAPAVIFNSIKATNSQLIFHSGNGGNGGNGTNGLTGDDGYGEVNILVDKKGDYLNFGKTGGNGGNGGNAGYGGKIVSLELSSDSTNFLFENFDGHCGNGGKGGNGGNGGKGGFYYNSLGSVWNCKGGSGGNGGNGGNGLQPGTGGLGGSIGDYGDASPVNGIGLGINFGSSFKDDDFSNSVGLAGKSGNSDGYY